MPYTIEVVTVGCGGNGEPSTIINFTKQGGIYIVLACIHMAQYMYNYICKYDKSLL